MAEELPARRRANLIADGSGVVRLAVGITVGTVVWECASCAGVNPSGTRFCGHCGLRHEVSAPLPVDDLIARLSRGQIPEQARDGRPTEQRRLVTALFADI